MLRALVDYISKSYHRSFQSLQNRDEPPSLREIVIFVPDDKAGDALCGDRLWPQLWAMEQVEPLVSDLLEEVYAKYLAILETAVEAAGVESPRAEALCLMSLLEGESIFTGSGRRWEGDREAVREAILKLISDRY